MDHFSGGTPATWAVEIIHQPLIPKVAAGRIDHEWFNTISYPLFRAGYHLVSIHMTDTQRKAWGIQPSLRGANQIDRDFVGESYFWANEHTKRNGLNQFVQVALHEPSHELSRATGITDLTHAYHDANPDISGIFSTYDMNNWQPVYKAGLKVQIPLAERLLSLLIAKKKTTLTHPVPSKFRKLISQAYGIQDASYKLTGRHIGTDYALPIGTPLLAPWDGTVTAVGTHRELGNYCHFLYTFQGETFEEQWCHLERIPRVGAYGRGKVVAHSGNTGRSTGPHLHRAVWVDDVRLDLINKTNWATMTVDPELLTYSV